MSRVNVQNKCNLLFDSLEKTDENKNNRPLQL